MFKTHSTSSGIVICGDSFDPEMPHNKGSIVTPFVMIDPPYGRIVSDYWDKEDNYAGWFDLAKSICTPDATIAVWGGIGKPNDRPFLEFLCKAEGDGWIMKNLVTWGKRRAYGVKDNYLFTREECAIFTRGKPTFNIPLLDVKRGYPGFNKKYPAKSEFKRRTNVWTDITELFRGKIHSTQKPDKLIEVLVNTHSNPGDLVVDLCAGSLTTARAATNAGREFYCVERDPNDYANGIATL